MKKCSYCGKDYPDDATICAVDQHPLVPVGPSAAHVETKSIGITHRTDAARGEASVDDAIGDVAFVSRLHFCADAVAVRHQRHLADGRDSRGRNDVAAVGPAHESQAEGRGRFREPVLELLVVLMALSFVLTTILGILMAVKYGKNRRVAYYCLGAGVVVPVLLIVIQLMMR